MAAEKTMVGNVMKKWLRNALLATALVIGIASQPIPVNAAGTGNSQTGEYGTFIDGSHVISDMLEHSGTNAHPRIIMSEEKFANLKEHIGDNSVTARLLEDLRSEADRHVREDPVSTYDAYGDDHLLETSKRIQRRVAALALAYNIFGDEKYAERAYKELKAACSFPDWSPKHFLDTAEMCTAFAYGYDWLYDWLNPAQRELLRTNMINKGLKQVMQDYTDTPRDRKRTYKWYQDEVGDNWQLVCTGGTNLAALAIGDEKDAKDIAAEVLTYGYKRAYSFVRRAYNTTDGTYIEGLGYWDYATYYLGLQSSALISAAGTDYGLADYEGVKKSAEFVRYMSSNLPRSFSFGDDRESRNTGWAVFLWLGEYLNSPEMSAIRLKNIGHDDDGFRYLDVLWIDESKQTGSGNNNATDWGSVGASNASFRNTWDESGIVAALHVGENNYKYHGHYDLGSFYIEANGSRFFTDLGNESYSLTNRQFSYRIKPEGHNTLVINPSKGTDQLEGANCLITGFGGGNEAYAVTDLTEAYGENGAKSVVRGLKMIKDKECVIVQDEISLNNPGEIYWFAHTKGQIAVAGDGRSAVVTVGSDRLWVGLLSNGGEFTVMKAEPLSTSLKVSGATSNSEYRKLAVHLTNTKDTTISVACIPLKKGESRPSWTPTVNAISEWSRDAEMIPSPTISNLNSNATGVRVNWDAVEGAALYRVFYRNGSGPWTSAGATSGTVKVVTGLTSGTNYTFLVRCLSADGRRYTSDYEPAKGKSLTYIAQPAVSSLNNAANGVEVKWNAVGGAAQYRVFYKAAGGAWTGYKNTTGTSMTVAGLTKGTTYSFTVRCLSADGKTYTSTYDTTGKTITVK